MLTFIKSLPQPLKALYILTFVVVAGGFILTIIQTITGSGSTSVPVWFPVVGALIVLIGICLVTNLNSSAQALAAAAKAYRPMGAGNSRFPATPGFLRFIGAFFVVFGGVFIFISLTFFS